MLKTPVFVRLLLFFVVLLFVVTKTWRGRYYWVLTAVWATLGNGFYQDSLLRFVIGLCGLIGASWFVEALFFVVRRRYRNRRDSLVAQSEQNLNDYLAEWVEQAGAHHPGEPIQERVNPTDRQLEFWLSQADTTEQHLWQDRSIRKDVLRLQRAGKLKRCFAEIVRRRIARIYPHFELEDRLVKLQLQQSSRL